jgi:hypothetical protein
MTTNRRARTATVAAGAAIGLRLLGGARRRRRLRGAAMGIRDAVDPLTAVPEPAEPPPEVDEAHAPGHLHVGPPPTGARRWHRRRGQRFEAGETSRYTRG